MKMDLFQSCGHCWAFQICWHIECSIFTASSFRTWNSSARIPSPRLTLFVWCFLRPTWLWTPGCLALGEWSNHRGYLGHEDVFLYSSSVYSATFLKYLLTLLDPYCFCPLLCPLLHEFFPGISNFLEEISSLSHSITHLNAEFQRISRRDKKAFPSD